MSGFGYFLREVLRDRLRLAGAAVMVLIASGTLGAGLLGALPVIQTILGTPGPPAPGGDFGAGPVRRDLPQLAAELNAALGVWFPGLGWARIPEAWIASLPAGAFTALVWILGALAVLTVIGATATFLHALLALGIVNRAATRARRRAFAAVIRAPLRDVAAAGPSDLISRIVNDSSKVADGLNAVLSKAVLQVFKGLASLGAALILNWQVTLAALAVTPVLYTVIRRLGKRIRRYSGRALTSQAGLYQSAGEAIHALRAVKVHTAEATEIGRFHRINKAMLSELNRVRSARALASPLTEMLTVLVLCALTLIAGRTILTNAVDPADFILVIASLAVAGASLKPLTGIINDVQAASPAADRLRAVIQSAREPGHERTLARLTRHGAGAAPGSIEFRAVSLRYPGAAANALDGVTLRVPGGSRVALVGPNGCGKTTLLSLVPRLLDPDAGSVLIDGTDVRTVSVRSLREQIGMVTQETVLFRGTVRDNLAYGARGADESRIRAAARMARADPFIDALPHGYDTPVGEGGLGLSGGQRQRLAIARALLRDPAILLLDEATSMIDAESEAAITAAVEDFSRGRTVIIIAHRLSTVLGCDRIVVMDAGRIIDQGPHDELLARCGLYRALAQSQLLAPAPA